MPLARSPSKKQQEATKTSASETVVRASSAASTKPGSSNNLRVEQVPCRVLENGWKEWIIKQSKFALPSRYTPIQKLGSGSYGLVISARDTETDEKVAIKRCGNVFKHCEDGKRVLREVKMMSMLDHRNILPIRDCFVEGANFQDVYVVTPALDTDLQQLIRSYKLSEQHVKYIMYQVLRALKYVHSANILHRDIKPANVLVNFDCHVKLCDFGLARGYDPNKKIDMTSYIVTRWYRAPELLLRNANYSGAIDIWSAGCLFAEMLLGKPLFSGESSVEQLRLICDTVAVPDMKDLWWVQNPKMKQYVVDTRQVAEERGTVKDLKTMLGAKASAQAMDMLNKMLCFSPYHRWSAEYLLDHPYLQDIKTGRHHAPATHKFRWRFDTITNLTEPQLRQLYFQELMRFHPENKFWPVGLRPSTPVSFEVEKADKENTNTITATATPTSIKATIP